MAKTSPARWRNIVIFTLLVLGIGNIAGLNYFAVQGLGGLLFILSPLLVTLGMRLFAGDGWGDAGFRPGLRAHPGVYLTALLLFPVLFALGLGIGAALSVVQFQPGWGRALAMAVLTGAPVVLIYAFSEEFSWRGYLEPRLESLGLPALPRHLLVAVIWWAWHVGYVLSQPGYTTLPLPLFFLLFFVAMVAMALLYGVWRRRTGSFWPAVIAHGVANTLAWPLLTPGIVTIDNSLAFAARPEALVVLAGLCLAALVAWRLPVSRESLRGSP
ncbi:CPBP family intramembrane glutamic endopeptidase [Sinisalibacter aestuarii]|uniref:CAAX amino protease n=1 Tax=Sinisalibacter aestuarii TaxID=2949426 RepID=A0ABQ5LVP4_9RHOB|nr:CPBP family intramembrane glutamic endopeptidase [Sinisalibacter aestuarii]GKY89052.1 CAAX amino protease [Sinisalibacter aestuarii]